MIKKMLRRLALSLVLCLICSIANAQYFFYRYREHATDCTALTDGKKYDLCHELDDKTFYSCVPSSGDCDTAGEWQVMEANLRSDPSACTSGQYVTDIGQDGTLTCAQVAFSQLSGSATDAQVPDNVTISLAATATALAANGANCSAGQFPLGVDASGAVETCSTSLSGNASTATALAANGANCSANSYPLGVDASGAVESCGTNISGNSGTATALAANGSNCSSGNYARGVDASGAAENCTADTGAGTNATALSWNVTVATCTGDGNGGNLTVNGSNQIVCAADDGGAGGSGDVTDVGNCGSGACFTGSSGNTLTSTTSEILDLSTDASLVFQRNTSGSTTFMGKDDTGPADTIYDTFGAGAITIGSADVTSVTLTTDGSGTGEVVLPSDSISAGEVDFVGTPTATAGNLLIADGTDFEGVVMSGDGTITSAGAFAIGANKVTDAMLATTETIQLPVYSARVQGSFVTATVSGADTATQGAGIDGGDGNWRLLYDATTDEAAVWQIRLPDYWAGHSELKILYSMSSATSGNVEFEGSVYCISPGDSADIGTASFAAAAVAADAVPGTAGFPDVVNITLTDDSCAAGDEMFIYLSTDANDATNDDATGDREVVGVDYEFTR